MVILLEINRVCALIVIDWHKSKSRHHALRWTVQSIVLMHPRFPDSAGLAAA